MLKLALTSAVLIAGVLTATAAQADPCAAPVNTYKAGTEITGVVRYVGDGDSLCVGSSRDPKTWIEIRVADFYAPELNSAGGRDAKRALERAAMGREAVCTVQRGNNGRTYSYDRLIAVCRVGGLSLGDSMRRAGVSEGGNGRR